MVADQARMEVFTIGTKFLRNWSVGSHKTRARFVKVTVAVLTQPVSNATSPVGWSQVCVCVLAVSLVATVWK